MRVVILGMHAPTVDEFIDKPPAYDEVWGLAHDQTAREIANVVFESHSREIVERHCPAHIDRLREIANRKPLFTIWPWGELLGPYHRMWRHADFRDIAPQMESSVAFPMAWAIHRGGVDEIHLYGVNMAADEEYGYQRPNMHYLIGTARAMGIDVHVADQSELFASQWRGGFYGSPDDVETITYRLE